MAATSTSGIEELEDAPFRHDSMCLRAEAVDLAMFDVFVVNLALEDSFEARALASSFFFVYFAAFEALEVFAFFALFEALDFMSVCIASTSMPSKANDLAR